MALDPGLGARKVLWILIQPIRDSKVPFRDPDPELFRDSYIRIQSIFGTHRSEFEALSRLLDQDPKPFMDEIRINGNLLHLDQDSRMLDTMEGNICRHFF